MKIVHLKVSEGCMNLNKLFETAPFFCFKMINLIVQGCNSYCIHLQMVDVTPLKINISVIAVILLF